MKKTFGNRDGDDTLHTPANQQLSNVGHCSNAYIVVIGG